MKHTAPAGEAGHQTKPESTEALLEGLIAECHGIIRDLVRPAYADALPLDRGGYVHAVTALADSAVKLGDAIGRLRGTVPSPELRQRITVEKIQTLPPARTGKAIPQLSSPRGEGG